MENCVHFMLGAIHPVASISGVIMKYMRGGAKKRA